MTSVREYVDPVSKVCVLDYLSMKFVWSLATHSSFDTVRWANNQLNRQFHLKVY